MNYVKFRIGGHNVNLDEVSEQLTFWPSHVCRESETRRDKLGHTFTHKEDVWTAGVEIATVAEIEESIKEFVSLLYSQKAFVQRLSKRHSTTLWITIYQDEVQRNLHFSREIISAISELGVELDITCMHLSSNVHIESDS